MNIINNIDGKTNNYDTKRRVIKSWENYEEPPIRTSEEDNIDRAGFLSIEQQYDAFKRAGINAVERLKAIYPEQKYIENEEDLLKNKDIVKMAESGINEPLDALDKKIKIDKKIKEGNQKLEKIQKENKEYEEKLKQQELIEKATQEALKNVNNTN